MESIDKRYNTMYINIDVYNHIIIKEAIDMQNANALLDAALQETSGLVSGETFIVRDLFKGYIWNRLPISDRLLLGTLFLHSVNTEKKGIVPLEKTPSGQQKYKMS